MGRSKKEERAEAPRFRSDEVIGDLLDREPRAAAVLASFGRPCDRCVVKDFETLAEGCLPLGLAIDDVLARLNALSATA